MPAFSNVWPAVSLLWTEGPRPSAGLTEDHTAGDLQGNRGDRKWGWETAPHSPVHLHSLQSQPHTLTRCPKLPTTPTSHNCPGPGTWDLSGLPCPIFLCAILVGLHCYNKLLRSRSIKQQKFFLRALKAGKGRIREPAQSSSVRALLLAGRQRLLTVPSHSEGKTGQGS